MNNATEIANLINELGQLDEAAWGAEDREQIAKASKLRARAREVKAALDALLARSS